MSSNFILGETSHAPRLMSKEDLADTARKLASSVKTAVITIADNGAFHQHAGNITFQDGHFMWSNCDSTLIAQDYECFTNQLPPGIIDDAKINSVVRLVPLQVHMHEVATTRLRHEANRHIHRDRAWSSILGEAAIQDWDGYLTAMVNRLQYDCNNSRAQTFSGHIDHLCDRIQAWQNKAATLDNIYSILTGYEREAQNNNVSVEHYLENLLGEMERLQSESESRRQSHNKGAAPAAQSSSSANDVQLAGLQQQIAQLTADRTALQQQLNTANSSLQQLSNTNNTNSSTLATNNAALAVRVNALQLDLSTAGNELLIEKGRADTANNLYRQAQNVADNERAKAADLENQLATATANARNEIAELNNKLRAATQQQQQAHQSSQQEQQTLRETQRKLKSAEDDFNTSKREIENLKQQLQQASNLRQQSRPAAQPARSSSPSPNSNFMGHNDDDAVEHEIDLNDIDVDLIYTLRHLKSVIRDQSSRTFFIAALKAKLKPATMPGPRPYKTDSEAYRDIIWHTFT